MVALLARWRQVSQVWCNLQVKSCNPYLSALTVEGAIHIFYFSCRLVWAYRMLIVQPLLIDPNVDNKTCLKLCEVWLAAFYPNLFLTFLCRSIVVPKRIGPGLADVCDSTCTERDRRKYRLGFFFTSTFDFSLCLLSYLFLAFLE